MDLSLILMGVGIVLIIISFFLQDRTKHIEKEVEELSIGIYQETNGIKRRLKIVEEELLLEPNFKVQSPKPAPKKTPMETFQQVASQMKNTHPSASQGQQASGNTKPIHSILVSQVIELDKQGLSIEEISKLSTLTPDQVRSILSNGGI
ncbi:hypothetical protein [Lysinibacillus odysseyi]|uniref:Uncharacterized protein n=1 Tax=Lysinibacillus odysseyi 34hs-1 = NBRC 100172 TaxID=1220589 RepID=A0A0A3I9Y8_9BACI|nr:hypothetical protein [Lysinibacillus odysseyi]KGR81576.1 hypothetical protein CD32_19675 [Lysinibacillus odysseyi 34hs-1 = NBRC 100172]